jgi:hypothetical protein
MLLVLPIGGQSTRFPNMRPKFLLTHPNGNMMLTESIRKLDIEKFSDILIIYLNEHEEKYKFVNPTLKEIQKEFKKTPMFVGLDHQTQSQPETIYEGLKALNIKDSVFIKDCDNTFDLKFNDKISENNFITVVDLEKIENIDAKSKSYVNIGLSGTVTNIAEKKIISNLFCCGGYCFKNSHDFIRIFEKIKNNKNLYVSHIIYQMILENEVFFTQEATNFHDWGTYEDWSYYKGQYSNLMIDIDGVLVLNSAKSFSPFWGTTEGIKENIECINDLHDKGMTRIILTTSRDEDYRAQTEEQLKKENVKYHQLVMGLYSAKRIIINDFCDTNKYPSALAINIERNSNSLKKYL